MGVSNLARDMVPSTSGRLSLAVEAMGRAAPGISALFARSFASLVGSGIPSPRPDVALQLSTPHGGHVNRMINTAETILELDYVLHKFRKLLRPANIGAATMKLEHLRRYEQSTPHSHKVLRVAAELHKYVDTYSYRLSLTQVANVVRGMSSAQYRLPPDLLVRLAAGLVAEGGAALRYAADSELRDVFYGFAGQGFTNPLFWSRLCAAVLPRLDHSFDPNNLPGLLRALEMAQQLPAPTPMRQGAAASREEGGGSGGGGSGSGSGSAEMSPQVLVARAALRLMAGSLERLQPGRLADAAGLLVTVGPQLDAVQVDEQLVARVQVAAMPFLPSLNPNQLTSLMLALLRLHQTTAAAPAASAAAAAAAPPPPLPEVLLTAAEPHLRAAVPSMQLLHVKRAVQALAPSVAPSLTQGSAAPAAPPPLAALLNMLARRAAQLLPTAAELAAGAPRQLTRGTLAHVPRGGKGAGSVMAAAARAGDPRVALDTPLLGLVEGLVRAYSRALETAAGGGGAATADARKARRLLMPDVAVLFERVAVVAAAGGARGLLGEEQRLSLAVRLPLLLAEDDALMAPLMLPAAAGAGGGGGAAALGGGAVAGR
ncbi:hypothetical protein PLESTB_000474100 [Pleodorina starrii]|uniref:Uncharacterized protein n=1 Tax=Pleodorina starrii TaxID=330485 RepID=A0A9W6BG59_9CHLO|nr:hypothetical protein PLESTM_001592600 [Pleodorina starrii]GLC51175.1 hypothetical protein PLESTB_000474100 [Pleodorina starrii]GLC63533.1 hypothetical protein PLESTF_000046600 [Pleodorina starrii]